MKSCTPFPQLLILTICIVFTSCQNISIDGTTIPNIIIIFTDDQGYQDLGCFGSPDIKTPNIDRLAEKGLKLTNFYSAQPVCSASRAALLTGCYPNRIGIHGAFMPNRLNGLNHDEITIAEMLKGIGYATAIFGKWHLGDHPEFMPLNHGFDEFYGIPYSNDMWPFHPQQGPIFNFGPLPLFENENIIDTLEDQSLLTVDITKRSVDFINRNKDNPFFLYIPHPQPHVPLYVSDKFKGKSDRGLYGDVIMEIDWSTGEILKALKEIGIEKNTMIIFTSDNGPWLSYGNHSGSAFPLREGKGTVWEGGVREPCIIYYPNKIEGGKTIDDPMMTIDILPTISEIVGLPLPSNKIDGHSLLSLLTAENKSDHKRPYFFYYHQNELHGVRYKKWKLYYPHKYRTMNGQEQVNDGFPGEYTHHTLEDIELYDLSVDVSESNNIASDHPDVISEINLLADSMRVKLGDKLYGITGKNNRPIGVVSQSENE